MTEKILTSLQKYFKFDVHFVFKSSFWLLIGHGVGITAALATSYAFANFLSPEVYGQYKYILSVGVLLSAFSLTGTATAITQAIAKNIHGFYEYIKRVNLFYSLIISAISLIGATYYHYNDNNALATGLVLITFLQPLFNNSALFYSYLIGKQNYKLSTQSHALKAIFTTIIIVVFTILTDNVTVLILSYFLSYIIVNYTLEFLFGPTREKIIDAAPFKKLTTYAKHTSLQGIISGIAAQLDKILIFQNLGSVELATYTFATALPDQYKGITKSVDMMLLPRFSNHSDKSIRHGIFYKSIIYFFFLLACLVLYIVLAPYIFAALFPQYESAVLLSQIYVTGIIFGIGGIPMAAIKSEMSNKKLYNFNLTTSIFQIIILLILLPIWGLLGAVIARVISRGFICSYAYYLYYRK